MILCNIDRLVLKYCGEKVAGSGLTFSERLTFLSAKMFITMDGNDLSDQDFLDDLSTLFAFILRNLNEPGVLTQDTIDMLFSMITLIYAKKNMPIQIIIDALKSKKKQDEMDDDNVGC